MNSKKLPLHKTLAQDFYPVFPEPRKIFLSGQQLILCSSRALRLAQAAELVKTPALSSVSHKTSSQLSPGEKSSAFWCQNQADSNKSFTLLPLTQASLEKKGEKGTFHFLEHLIKICANMRGNWMVKLCNYKDKMCYFHGFMIRRR